MIHLFKGIYADFDHNLNKKTHPYILISHIVGDGFVPEYCGNQLFVGKSWYHFLFENFNDGHTIKGVKLDDIQSLTAEQDDSYELEEKFWNFLISDYSDEKLTLYFDPINFRIFYSKYLQIIFNTSSEKFLDSYYFLTTMGYQFFHSKLGRKERHLERRYEGFAKAGDRRYIDEDQSLYENLHHKLDLNHLPTEVLLVNFLINNTSKVELYSRIEKICEDFVKKELFGLKRDLIKSLPVVAKYYSSQGSFNTFDQKSFEKCFSESGAFGAILNLSQDLDLESQIGEVKSEVFYIYEDFQKRVKDYCDFNFCVMKKVLLENNNELLELIDKDISLNMGSYFLCSSSHDNYVNPYIVSHIYEMYRVSPDKLKDFSREIVHG